MNKNILIIADDCRIPTGVANQTAEIIKGLFNIGFKVYQIGVVNIKQPSQKHVHKFETGEEVTIYTSQIYDDVNLIITLIKELSIDCLVLFTDPHRFQNVWDNAPTIRQLCPILYYTIWDTNLLPHPEGRDHFNTPIYESVDSLACISKQTENFCRQIVNRLPEERRPAISYVPHGSDANIFKPLSEPEKAAFKEYFFGQSQFDFVVTFNSRNQLRKKPQDLMYAFRLFNESIGEDNAKRTCLFLHTEPVSNVGTNLGEVAISLCPKQNIFIHGDKVNPQALNAIYNISDVIIQPSNAEGFGLSINEAMLAGRPIAATVTGGLQDQIGFYDDAGLPIVFSKDFTSNNVGKYRRHGIWSYPMFPDAQSIIGSPVTPYLFDDDCSHNTIKNALLYWYNTPKEEREQAGLKGREYCFNNKLNNLDLVSDFAFQLEQTIKNFKPVPSFQIYKAI